MSFLTPFFGDPNAREVKKVQPIIDQVGKLEPKFQAMSDEELRAQTERLSGELTSGKTLDDILPEAFAVAREASRRALGMRHFDVQLIGGYFLHQGNIVEMKTGEGKTLVATLPIYLNALSGKGVHLVTVNDYLARRDSEWMGKLYDFLGLTVSCIQNQGISYQYDKNVRHEISMSDRELKERGLDAAEGEEQQAETSGDGGEAADGSSSHAQVEMRNLRPISRREAYQCDIVYGTNNEFGFDYLRDNMVQELGQKVQRELSFAIVDEVDSILIDEARTPLIISAPAEESTDQYYRFAQLVVQLVENEDYNIDEKLRASTLTEAGISKMEQWLGVENIYVEGGVSTVHHIEQALKAHALFRRDRDYVVKDGEILIVDEFTGRLMYGRRYSEGLHQAIEAKEGVEIKRESQTMATITFQNLFRLYHKLSGMTGTALTEAEEFSKIYKLEVMAIPTNKTVVRHDLNDRIYKTEMGKFRAVISDIKERNQKGQPVLLGTISIDKNELLSDMLNREGVPHQVLNAKFHDKEALIIAQAGKLGAVTVATNMAGRGVDIILGGSPQDASEAARVRELGGLHVIGTERHEARRIDNQLRGRGGRQGDPGSSQFYVSCEDDLMRIFGSDRIKNIMETLKIPEDMPIENKFISKSLESAQRRVEGHHFDIRKNLVEYDDVMNKHREVVYKRRDEILRAWEQEKRRATSDETHGETKVEESVDGQNNTSSSGKNTSQSLKNTITTNSDRSVSVGNPVSLRDLMLDQIEDELGAIVSYHTAGEYENNWNVKEIVETVKTISPLTSEEVAKLESYKSKGGDRMSAKQEFIDYLVALSESRYELLEKQVRELSESPLAMREVEKNLMLRAIDSLWVEHLEAMGHLRTGIGLRGYGQRDPLVEYKKEGFRMFGELLSSIQKQVVYAIYKIGPAVQIAPSVMEKARQILQAPAKTMSAGQRAFSDDEPVSETVAPSEKVRDSEGNKVGRNDPCPCRSGKKYKKCHGR